MIDVSVIIINYNTDELTLQAVNSVIKYTDDISYEIIVIDNNSQKNTKLATYLKNISEVKFYKLKKNIGFGGANNFGYKKSKGKYIYLLNSDAYLIENSINILYKYIDSHSDVASCGCKLLFENGNQNFAFGNFLSLKKILNDKGLYYVTKKYKEEKIALSRIVKFTEPTEVDYISGAAVMFRREIIDLTGFFDRQFFMYYEDMELSYRFIKHGYKNIIIPTTKVVHIGGQSGLISDFNNVFLRNEAKKSKHLFLRIKYNQTIVFLVSILEFNYIRLLLSIRNKISSYIKIFGVKLI